MAEPIRTVAVVAPGDMGHAVAALLRRRGGLRVITCLRGRSARTRALAGEAGVEDVADDAALLAEAEALLSILVPAHALDLAERIAAAAREGGRGRGVLYVDCNAVAPQTARRVGEVVEAAGLRFVDAGIIGPPPQEGKSPRFYASGPHADDFAALRDAGLDVRVVGDRAGQASAVKMCYAALTKGTTALMTELSVAAERLGVSEPLREEFAFSQAEQLAWMRRWVTGMVPKAHRWVGEMAEIAKTFEASGLTPKTFEGAAEVYRFVAGTPPGAATPEEWAEAGRAFEEVVAELAAARPRR